MIQLLKTTREIWEKTRIFNIEFKRKEPALKGFFWPCWNFMMPEIRIEYLQWVHYLLKNDMPDFSADERHNQAIQNRIAHGWKLGERRDNAGMTDPYLIPLCDCPDWFQTWCLERDNLMKEHLKGVIWRKK
jgi:hypothetical protein